MVCRTSVLRRTVIAVPFDFVISHIIIAPCQCLLLYDIPAPSDSLQRPQPPVSSQSIFSVSCSALVVSIWCVPSFEHDNVRYRHHRWYSKIQPKYYILPSLMRSINPYPIPNQIATIKMSPPRYPTAYNIQAPKKYLIISYLHVDVVLLFQSNYTWNKIVRCPPHSHICDRWAHSLNSLFLLRTPRRVQRLLFFFF